jgi:hypothetical protein
VKWRLQIKSDEDRRMRAFYKISIQTWEDQWLMPFNPYMCVVLQIATKRTPLQFKYTVHM